MERGDETALARVARDRVHPVAEPPPLTMAETGRPISRYTTGDRSPPLVARLGENKDRRARVREKIDRLPSSLQ